MTLNGSLFGVTASLLVSTVPPILLDSTELEGLRVDWTIRKTISSTPDECTVTIYNLDGLYREAVRTCRRSNGIWASEAVAKIQLSLGWSGSNELAFGGDVISTEAARQDGADIVTTLRALTGGSSWRTPPAGGSAFGLAASAILITEASRLGHTVTPATLALVESEAAARAITAWTPPGGQEGVTLLNWLFATLDLTWSVDSFNRVAVYKYGLRTDLGVVGLGPLSGLITYTAADDGVDFEALAQPRVVPGCPIQFSEAGQFGIERPVGAPLRCESVEFTGSTYGQSLMRGTARRIEVTV